MGCSPARACRYTRWRGTRETGGIGRMEINLNTGERLYSSPVSEVFAAALETVLVAGDLETEVDVVEHSIVFAVGDGASDERRLITVSVAATPFRPTR